jgi:hypothetical protein
LARGDIGHQAKVPEAQEEAIMADETEGRPPQSGGENRGVDEDVVGPDDAGRRAADVTPPIGEDAEPGQTSSPAEPGEVGVPPDERLGE